MDRLDPASVDRVLDFLDITDRVALAAACPTRRIVDAVRDRLYRHALRKCRRLLADVRRQRRDRQRRDRQRIETLCGIPFWFNWVWYGDDEPVEVPWHLCVLCGRGRALLSLTPLRLRVASRLRRRAARPDCEGRVYAALVDAVAAESSLVPVDWS